MSYDIGFSEMTSHVCIGIVYKNVKINWFLMHRCHGGGFMLVAEINVKIAKHSWADVTTASWEFFSELQWVVSCISGSWDLGQADYSLQKSVYPLNLLFVGQKYNIIGIRIVIWLHCYWNCNTWCLVHSKIKIYLCFVGVCLPVYLCAGSHV